MKYQYHRYRLRHRHRFYRRVYARPYSVCSGLIWSSSAEASALSVTLTLSTPLCQNEVVFTTINYRILSLHLHIQGPIKYVFLQPKDRDTACLRNSAHYFWHTMNEDLHKWASYLFDVMNKRSPTCLFENRWKNVHEISYSEGLLKFVNMSSTMWFWPCIIVNMWK